MNRTTTIDDRAARGGARGRRLGETTAVCARLAGRIAPFAGLLAGLALGWLALPAFLYRSEAQPLDFNHAVHAEQAGLGCADCHGFAADGSFVGIPPTASCAECHADVLGESAAEKQLVERYIGPEQEIPWLSYYDQPQNVLFSHASHVVLAQIECRRCHGDHGTSTTLPLYESNRISTYSRRIWGPRIAGGGAEPWDSMKMSDCSGCHAERGVQDSCLMCHR